MESLNVLLLPEPGSGHLMSLIEAGKRLLGHGRELTVTVLIVRPPTPESASEVDAHVRRVAASGIGVRFHRLPAVDPPTEGAGNVQEFKSRYLELHKPHVAAAALVVDFFATTALDVARGLAVPAYVYFTSTATTALVVDFFATTALDVARGLAVPAGSIPGFLGRRNSPNFTWFVYHGRRFMDADGIIVNMVAELEPGLLSAIAEGRCVPGRPAPPLYPIGPVLGVGGVPVLREHGLVRRREGARGRSGAGAERAPVSVGAARASRGRLAAPVGRRPRRAPPGGVPGADQGQGPGVAAVGAAEGGARPPIGGRLRDALRVELDAGEPVARRAAGAVAAVRGAAPERVRARGRDERRRGHGGGQEAGQLRGGGRAGAGGEVPDGRRRGGADGAGEGCGDEGRVPEGRGGGRVVARGAGEAARCDPRGCMRSNRIGRCASSVPDRRSHVHRRRPRAS